MTLADLLDLPQQITPHLASLIAAGDAMDPIARQFLHDPAEDIVAEGELARSHRGRVAQPSEGHCAPRARPRAAEAADRVRRLLPLLLPARAEFAADDGLLSEAELDAALAYIAHTPQIWEVILTGGDPLVLSPRRLGRIVQALSAMPHVGVIRFHTRQPVSSPASITPELVAALESPKAVWGAVHCNHAREITPETQTALARIVNAGIPMLSQTVLLRGVNGPAWKRWTLCFRRLVELRVKPYYLHHGDLARGTGHFRTTILEGQKPDADAAGHSSRASRCHFTCWIFRAVRARCRLDRCTSMAPWLPIRAAVCTNTTTAHRPVDSCLRAAPY